MDAFRTHEEVIFQLNVLSTKVNPDFYREMKVYPLDLLKSREHIQYHTQLSSCLCR